MAVLGAVVFITVLGNPVGATYKEEKDQSMAQDSGKISAQEVFRLLSSHWFSGPRGDLQELGEEAILRFAFSRGESHYLKI